MNLKLKKFDMSSIKSDKVVLFIGKRETGKSFLVRDLLWHNRDLPVGTVISGTEGANQFYSKMIPSIFIHDEYTPEIINNFVKRQGRLIKKQVGGAPEYQNIDPRAFLILDDCLYDNSWVKDKNVRSLFMNGRHFKAFFIITSQYSLGIPPNLRTNVDYVFVLRETIHSNRRRLFEQYCGMFPTYEFFCSVMDQCTENFECLVIDNNSKSSKLEQQAFWYKGTDHPEFKLGADILWKQSSNMVLNDDSDDENPDFLSSYNNSKNNRKPRLEVKKQYH
jgi:hypothetical protein